MKPNVPVLRRQDYEVRAISRASAAALIAREHYAGGGPNTGVFLHGLFRRGDDVLLGVAWWLPPTPVVARSIGGTPTNTLALTRLAIVAEVPQNGATFLLAASRRLVQDSGRWTHLVTYADEGQGHTGTIYRADNWAEVPAGRPRPRWVDATGRHVAIKAAATTRSDVEMLALGYIKTPATRKRKFVRDPLMARQPCKECHWRPKYGNRQRCITCLLRHEPIDVQVAGCRRRLGMVPMELRRARIRPDLWPAGTRWCAGCQSFRDLEDMAGGGKGSRCRACQSWATHGAMLERTYDLTRAQYDELLALQGGRCAICRNLPGKKRLAVDHDHKTGAVRGLLCSRCNHDLMGAAWDSEAMARALLTYVQRPPATGAWTPPEAPQPPEPGAGSRHGLSAPGGGSVPRETSVPVALDRNPWERPVGAIKDPNIPGKWLVFMEPGLPGDPAPF